MRRRALILVLLGSCLAAATGAETLLDFTALDLDGAEFDLRVFEGRPVLLDFWGTWCAPCVHAFPKLKKLHADYGEQLAVVGLAFYSGEPAEIAAFAAEHELDYTVLAGHEETIERFEVFAFPSYILISSEGEIVFRQAGQMADLYERVAAYLDQGAAERTAVSSASR